MEAFVGSVRTLMQAIQVCCTKKFTLLNADKLTGQHFCREICKGQGDTCQRWTFENNSIIISTDKDNCHLYNYTPNKTKKNRAMLKKGMPTKRDPDEYLLFPWQ